MSKNTHYSSGKADLEEEVRPTTQECPPRGWMHKDLHLLPRGARHRVDQVKQLVGPTIGDLAGALTNHYKVIVTTVCLAIILAVGSVIFQIFNSTQPTQAMRSAANSDDCAYLLRKAVWKDGEAFRDVKLRFTKDEWGKLEQCLARAKQNREDQEFKQK